jgi:hypothetical protein
MQKEYQLKKDIVIKAGTKFHMAPIKVVRSASHVEHIIGFGKDNTGSLVVCVDDPKMKRWFKEVKEPATKKVAKKRPAGAVVSATVVK